MSFISCEKMKKDIVIGSDHAGFMMKEFLKKVLTTLNYSYIDIGTYTVESVDYPDIAHNLAKSVVNGEVQYGIIICGSGNGVSIVANKYKEIRCALCWNTSLAKLAREHNNANVLALPARFVSNLLAKKIMIEFLNSNFEGGRHTIRVNKI